MFLGRYGGAGPGSVVRSRQPSGSDKPGPGGVQGAVGFFPWYVRPETRGRRVESAAVATVQQVVASRSAPATVQGWWQRRPAPAAAAPVDAGSPAAGAGPAAKDSREVQTHQVRARAPAGHPWPYPQVPATALAGEAVGAGAGEQPAEVPADDWFKPERPEPRPSNREMAFSILLQRLLRRRVTIRSDHRRFRGILIRLQPDYVTLATDRLLVVNVVLRHISAVESN